MRKKKTIGTLFAVDYQGTVKMTSTMGNCNDCHKSAPHSNKILIRFDLFEMNILVDVSLYVSAEDQS